MFRGQKNYRNTDTVPGAAKATRYHWVTYCCKCRKVVGRSPGDSNRKKRTPVCHTCNSYGRDILNIPVKRTRRMDDLYNELFPHTLEHHQLKW